MGDTECARMVRPELRPGECKRINRTGKVVLVAGGCKGWASRGLEYEVQVRNGTLKI